MGCRIPDDKGAFQLKVIFVDTAMHVFASRRRLPLRPGIRQKKRATGLLQGPIGMKVKKPPEGNS
jgi:hypothetical protein